MLLAQDYLDGAHVLCEEEVLWGNIRMLIRQESGDSSSKVAEAGHNARRDAEKAGLHERGKKTLFE